MPNHRCPFKEAAKVAGERFYSNFRPCGRGHDAMRYTNNGKCVACISDGNRKRREDSDFRERASARHHKWRRENIDRALTQSRTWYENNKARSLELSARWQRENKEAKRLIQRKYDRSRAHLPEVRRHYALKAQMRKKRIRQARPAWVNTDEIWNFYKNCPEGMTVDHIVPLLGINPDNGERNVSGLHVPWNFQYLTAPENSAKSNKWSNEDSTGPLALAPILSHQITLKVI